ncbi:xanthine dehydrogenase family protein molybdopterin-binding subunit [Sphingomonas faeni]|uniref:xanthine dehydrogenase family protein molybdopterin-binding subunit n=1 Tax=Sphingomonas faeni TaxID=185950 RepID=UPI0027D84632|nr:xanthine dehydrogenase family protein molybdopterin-binding subunit [Sphingomonas faeni]
MSVGANGEPISPPGSADGSSIRVDGRCKVSGTAEFPGDVRPPGVCYGALATSAIARGRMVGIDPSVAEASPGVLLVLTHLNVEGEIAHVDHLMAGGWANSSHRPLSSPDIHYAGQIVALVVAETAEQARDAVHLLEITYEPSSHVGRMDDPNAKSERLAALRPGYRDRRSGDAEAGFVRSTVVIEQRYSTPVQHQHPLELPSTTCVWSGDHLTVFEPTRFVGALKHGLAAQLGIVPERVRVVSPFIGGHFGSKMALSQHTALAAVAARRIGRAVQAGVSRADATTFANHRTETSHTVKLGADRRGLLLAMAHSATAATSRFDTFAMEGTDVSTALYACPNVRAEERVARVDRNTPGPMRAPPETTYLFALESAMDELAHELAVDPIELRRLNDTQVDTVAGRPFTTRPLMRCFDEGASAFGWNARSVVPGEARSGEWLIGHGCAAAALPTKIGSASIRVTRSPDGTVLVETAHHEIGNGLYTILALTASDRLGVPVDRVSVHLGDTTLPPSGISGGSSTTATLINALAQACRQLNESRAGEGGSVEIMFGDAATSAKAREDLERGHIGLASSSAEALAWAFGAHFIEVGVHVATAEIRVRRHVGAFAAGRIVNPVLARSQLLGGMIWGQSSALFEETVVDKSSGSYVNRDFGEYLVPTAADVGDMTVIIVPDQDPEVNAEGVKGLGEIGIAGVNAAVANAVFNATGRRIRNLPIRLDALL